jgi:hypothetical protein
MTVKPVSFRIPSKYVVFLDSIAADQGADRTKILVKILDRCLQDYLSGRNQV